MTDSDSLLVAYLHGADSMKDRIAELEAERDALKAELTEAKMRDARMRDLWQAVDKTEGWQV